MCRENCSNFHFHVSSVTAIFGEFLHSSYAKIPRKQRFKGNHCWKLALFNEKVLHIERGAGKAGASTDILDFISWEVGL